MVYIHLFLTALYQYPNTNLNLFQYFFSLKVTLQLIVVFKEGRPQLAAESLALNMALSLEHEEQPTPPKHVTILTIGKNVHDVVLCDQERK